MERKPRPLYEGPKKSSNYASNAVRAEAQKISIQRIIKAEDDGVIDLGRMKRKEIMEILGGDIKKHHVTKARKIIGINLKNCGWSQPRISKDGAANERLLQTWGRT